MSQVHRDTSDEELPGLREGEHYVIQLFPTGTKRTVVQREMNILDKSEADAHPQEVQHAMYDELTRWLTLGAFTRSSKSSATNLIDARWVLKWKVIDGKRTIQARLVVRGLRTYKPPSCRPSQVRLLAGASVS